MFYAGIDMLFSILFPILFLVVLGMILYTIIGNISTWNKNNHSPRLTVPATVVAKRTEVSRHHTDNTMAHADANFPGGTAGSCPGVVRAGTGSDGTPPTRLQGR